MAKNEKLKSPASAAPAPPTAVAPAAPAVSVWTIRTKNPGFRGERFGVRIFDGVGTTNDPKAAASCQQIGYTVEGPPLFGVKPASFEETNPPGSVQT